MAFGDDNGRSVILGGDVDGRRTVLGGVYSLQINVGINIGTQSYPVCEDVLPLCNTRVLDFLTSQIQPQC